MKVITLNIYKDDSTETEVLFAINDVNNINEAEFVERIKKKLRAYVGCFFSLNETDEKLKLRSEQYLKTIKEGGDTLFLSRHDYLDAEEVDVL